jgi:hypothetical protein
MAPPLVRWSAGGVAIGTRPARRTKYGGGGLDALRSSLDFRCHEIVIGFSLPPRSVGMHDSSAPRKSDWVRDTAFLQTGGEKIQNPKW